MTLIGNNLTVRISDKTLVNNVSITVEPGEIYAVIGPNGAGKSTLLRAITGDIQPESGQVLMDGIPLKRWKRRDRARVRGILAQSNTLNFGFSVLQVVLMGRSPHSGGRENRRDYAIARDALDACEVLHLEDRVYTTLSGGERQRVQLARVLAQIWEPSPDHPRYLLMDEPTNNLDLTHQHSTLKRARQFAQAGTAVFVILHDLNLAAEYADKILLINQGETHAIGTPQTVLTPQNIFDTFKMRIVVTAHPLNNRPLIVPVTDDIPQPIGETV
jgi:iron complex transport system ATP-binding protein